MQRVYERLQSSLFSRFYIFSAVFTFFQMQDLPIPNELLEFVEEDGAYTPFSEPIAYIFSNMIKEYMRAIEILNVNENNDPDRIPKGYTKSLSKYNKIATAIENEMRKQGYLNPKPLVQGSFLLSFCHPDEKQLRAGRAKKILTPTYIYLNKLLEQKNKRAGRDWIDKWKENERKITIEDWNALTNFLAFQWCSFLKISNAKDLIKRVKCIVKSNSAFYRFGFKLFRTHGKLFGDGSIQSADNNLVIHFGKDHSSEELFVTIYKNGIRTSVDKYLNQKQPNNGTPIELYIDEENFLYFKLNGNEVYKTLINKEIRQEIYMLAWADAHEYQVQVENIEISY